MRPCVSIKGLVRSLVCPSVSWLKNGFLLILNELDSYAILCSAMVVFYLLSFFIFLFYCISFLRSPLGPLSKLSQLASGLPAGSRALPAGSRALLARLETLPAGSRALPAGSRVHPAGSEALPAGSRALPAGSKPPQALLCGSTIGHRPLRGRCPLTTKTN